MRNEGKRGIKNKKRSEKREGEVCLLRRWKKINIAKRERKEKESEMQNEIRRSVQIDRNLVNLKKINKAF